MMRQTPSGSGITLEGRIEKLGITTYQYGTHAINFNGKPYALKSSAVMLDNYLGKEVSLKGVNVDGYPLEGGPELVEVTEIILR